MAAAAVMAITAWGVIVIVEPDEFVGILKRQQGALVVHATGRFFRRPVVALGSAQVAVDALEGGAGRPLLSAVPRC